MPLLRPVLKHSFHRNFLDSRGQLILTSLSHWVPVRQKALQAAVLSHSTPFPQTFPFPALVLCPLSSGTPSPVYSKQSHPYFHPCKEVLLPQPGLKQKLGFLLANYSLPAWVEVVNPSYPHGEPRKYNFRIILFNHLPVYSCCLCHLPSN